MWLVFFGCHSRHPEGPSWTTLITRVPIVHLGVSQVRDPSRYVVSFWLPFTTHPTEVRHFREPPPYCHSFMLVRSAVALKVLA